MAISILLILIVIAAFTYRLYLLRLKRKAERDELPNDLPPMDEMQEETYNGRPLWITEAERPSWDAFSREEKRRRINATEKLIKQGKLYVHTDNEGFTGLLTKKEAKEKGYLK